MWDFTKDEKVKKTLENVIRCSEKFNISDFPIVIEEIKIYGSVLRKEKAGDIDLILRCFIKPEEWEEWSDFKKVLNGSTFELKELLFELGTADKKASIDGLIQRYRVNIVNLGFKDHWINSWLNWVRVGDIDWGYEKSLSITAFEEEALVLRFFANNCKGKRRQFHVECHHPITGEQITIPMSNPSIIIWSSKKGAIEPSNESLTGYLRAEALELITSGKKIIAGSDDLPVVFRDAIKVSKEDESEVIDRLEKLKNYWSSNGIDTLLTIRASLKKGLLKMQETLKLLVSTNTLTLDNASLKGFNTRLRSLLEEIETLGALCELINTPRVLYPDCFEKIDDMMAKNADLKLITIDIILPWFSTRHLEKKKILEILERIDFTS
jgi:hypothetical protein